MVCTLISMDYNAPEWHLISFSGIENDYQSREKWSNELNQKKIKTIRMIGQ